MVPIPSAAVAPAHTSMLRDSLPRRKISRRYLDLQPRGGSARGAVPRPTRTKRKISVFLDFETLKCRFALAGESEVHAQGLQVAATTDSVRIRASTSLRRWGNPCTLHWFL